MTDLVLAGWQRDENGEWRNAGVHYLALGHSHAKEEVHVLLDGYEQAVKLLEELGPPARWYDERDPNSIEFRRKALLSALHVEEPEQVLGEILCETYDESCLAPAERDVRT